MVPDGDLEPAVVGAILQAVQGRRERRHVDARPVAEVVVDLPAGVESQEQDPILGPLDEESLVGVVRRIILPAVDAAVEVRVEVGKSLAVQPVVAQQRARVAGRDAAILRQRRRQLALGNKRIRRFG